MLELASVTLACIDTRQPALARRALLKSAEGIRFARTLLLTSAEAAAETTAGLDAVAIPTIDSRDDYSRFVLKDLLRFVETPHVLLVQWDGYVLNPLAWDPRFLECDYLGARWFWEPEGFRIGNGGFSLRSRRLLEALADPRIELVEAEDLTIGRTYRTLLEREHGIRFADEALADRFAFEAAYPVGQPFGFHGLYNFCRAMPPAELAALVPAFSDAIAQSVQCARLLRNCVSLSQWQAAIALGRRMLAANPQDTGTAAMLEQAEAAAAQGAGVGRNDPCPCGSGKRYKQCHGAIGAPPMQARAAGGAIASASAAAAAPIGVDQQVATAMAAHQRGDLAAAEAGYRSALALVPDHPHALHYLGVVHYQRGRPEEALPLMRAAVERVPAEPEFHNNLGIALAAVECDQDAIDAFGRALALRPDHAGALNNLGLSLRELNRVDEAIDAYRRALALQPAFIQARWNLALALLAKGDWNEGLAAYEARLAIDAFAPGTSPPTAPRWEGEPLAGRTLLLVAEQGLGDAIHFARFAARLADRGARVVIQAPRALVRLLSTVPGVAGVVAIDEPRPAFDVWLPLLSLPLLLKLEGPGIPRAMPYLSADAVLRSRAASELARLGPGTRIGLAWAGNPRHAGDRRRSVRLEALAPLLDAGGVQWVSLQKDEPAEAERALASRLAWLPSRSSLDATAALIAELDLVIAVDTSIAHLAGALAKPVWIALAHASDWRWGLAGDMTPWYPTARLFRQPKPGDWAAVVQSMLGALAER